MRERISTVGVTGTLVGALGLCCGIPVLLALGSLGALAGITWDSWLLIALGLVTLAFADPTTPRTQAQTSAAPLHARATPPRPPHPVADADPGKDS